MQVPPGHAILFCGYTMHTGVPITAGTRYVLTGFVDFRAAVEAVRPFYGLIPGALPTPELHAECLSLFTGTLSTLRLERAACMQVLTMAPAPLSSQARCPHRMERAATTSPRHTSA